MFNEKILYQNYFSNKISEETLAEQLKLSDKDFPLVVQDKMKQDLDEKDAEMLEYHLYSVFMWEASISPEKREPLDIFADTLNRLLLCVWHKQHEDIVTLLQKISAESSVDVLYKAIYLKLPYLEWDDNFSFQKKCVRAINHIGGEKARRYLELLCQEKNPIIRELAERKRKENYHAEYKIST